jgi:hypothetical protein
VNLEINVNTIIMIGTVSRKQEYKRTKILLFVSIDRFQVDWKVSLGNWKSFLRLSSETRSRTEIYIFSFLFV